TCDEDRGGRHDPVEQARADVPEQGPTRRARRTQLGGVCEREAARGEVHRRDQRRRRCRPSGHAPAAEEEAPLVLEDLGGTPMSLADRLAKAQQRDRISDVRTRVQERLVEVLGPRLYDSTMSDTELEGLVHQRLRELLDEEEGPLSSQEKLLIVRQIGDSVLGLGPL